MSKISAVTDQSFKSEVLQSDVPVVVDFWAEWCGPCRMVSPVLDEIATQHGGKLKIVKLNIDENPMTTRAYGVSSIPMMLVFSEGKMVKGMLGAKPKRTILDNLSEYIG